MPLFLHSVEGCFNTETTNDAHETGGQYVGCTNAKDYPKQFIYSLDTCKPTSSELKATSNGCMCNEDSSLCIQASCHTQSSDPDEQWAGLLTKCQQNSGCSETVVALSDERGCSSSVTDSWSALANKGSITVYPDTANCPSAGTTVQVRKAETIQQGDTTWSYQVNPTRHASYIDVTKAQCHPLAPPAPPNPPGPPHTTESPSAESPSTFKSPSTPKSPRPPHTAESPCTTESPSTSKSASSSGATSNFTRNTTASKVSVLIWKGLRPGFALFIYHSGTTWTARFSATTSELKIRRPPQGSSERAIIGTLASAGVDWGRRRPTRDE